MTAEETLNQILKDVLDIKPEDIIRDRPLAEAHEVDSTEMVEISVGLKKNLQIEIGDNELKKTHTYQDILGILADKGAS
ncbi:MAG: acyl carrier protein [Candidatus Omnitrophica bacterium]|nr:acyl carrier protein [Candidatus Omnitrophota bacterium]MCA9403543.1 acyl carrier protein [Candidatus Omnitrophota bacterium]MCB9721395.1 acyl carrier protein [Candidatus Omnitrophota bacterium]